ncbi:MAG TPA: DUF3105 domain-containing protein, partial [Herpetosiphonaceae bacterium]|nr:DUF3105 domain-containing protein [Herpetosiphonaceae bacterium]
MRQEEAQTQHANPSTAIQIPERPSLVANVQLVGEMQGTGFVDRQWLVQRDGQFIQLTELLYRVAEQANGERTLEEIGAGVTEATEWNVTADNVRQIIEAKLIPMRLIATREDADASRQSQVPERQARSPLGLSMRTAVIGPHIIDPIAKLLQILHAPLILVPMLLVIAVAHWWLYRIHGVAGSIVQLIYTPALLLAVLGIMLVAGIFHEFGHASALRYGGGKVRGMGVGIYLVYPAFYTDVTDSYRLGRWARVRTDLGGFYFYLIFTLAIIGLYLVTGQEFLLAVVLLINLDIIRQCLPFVRFDGYWALADLTGIPDFFSQMGPFLASVLPIPGLKGTRLPKLRRWVKVVFALYIVATVPVLVFLAFLLVTRAPTLLATVWSSFLRQIGALPGAWSTGNLLRMALLAAQILLLGIEMLAIAYLLFNLARTLVRAVWNWSRPTPARRVAGGLIMAGALSLLAFRWIPQLPSLQAAPPPGVQSFEVTERDHVQVPVNYPQTPPVGGDHALRWQTCGFYDVPVASENVVHSMEHGAVWITYRPDLGVEEIDSLRRLASRWTHVLVSPFPDLPAPVVASAWGRQLRLDSAGDPRLLQFIRA